MRIPPALYAEYFGTFFFVLAVLASGGQPVVVGGALALVVFLIGGISGGHVNPAVSLSNYFLGKLNPNTLAVYILAQAAGAFSAWWAYSRLY